MLKPKYFVLIQPYVGHICWDSCLWTEPLRMCHLLKKLENESTKDEEREKQEKGGTHKGSESSVALLQSPPLYILYNHKDRCNLNCVCIAMDVSFWFPVCIPGAPYCSCCTDWALAATDCRFYLIWSSSAPRLSTFQTHFLFPLHWLKRSACAQ